MPYDTESQSRNADFISIARRAIHNPRGRRCCRPLSEAMHSEHDLKERQRRTNHSESFPLWGATLLHNLRRSRAPFLKSAASAATTPSEPSEPSEPSRPKGVSTTLLHNLPPAGGAQRTHFVGAQRRTKCSESFPLEGPQPSARQGRQSSRRRRVK